MLSRTRPNGLQVEEVGTVTVAQLPGPALLDALFIRDIGQQLTELVQGLGISPRLVLNFSQVEHLSSAMVGKVLALHNLVAAAGGRLVVCGLRQHLAVVFSLTGLDRMLKIYADEADALLSF